jgi:hypothetical protein
MASCDARNHPQNGRGGSGIRDEPNRLCRACVKEPVQERQHQVITLAQIKEFVQTKPFRPFAIETVGGNYITVQSPEHIKLPPPNFDLLIVFGSDGLVHHLAADSLANAAVYGPTPHE